MTEGEFFEKMDRIRSDLEHTTKLFRGKGGSTSNATILLVDEFKELAERFKAVVNEFLGPAHKI